MDINEDAIFPALFDGMAGSCFDALTEHLLEHFMDFLVLNRLKPSSTSFGQNQRNKKKIFFFFFFLSQQLGVR